jgi:catechol 2,3-dioxygenase-like lactoylglutathione lyase family enzyme
LLLASLVAGARAAASPLASAVDSVDITVSDTDRAVDFYCRVLSFKKVRDTELAGETYENLEGIFGVRMRVVRLQLGDEFIDLTEYLAPKGRPITAGARSNDRSFQHIAIVVSDMDKAYAWLHQNRVEQTSSGPQRLPNWNRNASGIKAFYFKDRDGHPLEILEFPPDKGAEKWHRPSDKLFLGIDHTAIVVGDTEASLRFYRDLLGMRIVGESENYGLEQEHLSNVFGAHLRITSLRAGSGPGVELLEYLSPRDGSPFPIDEHANDVIHRQTVVITKNAEPAARDLFLAKVNFVSSGVIANHKDELGYRTAFIVRDPDGHAVEIEQK